MYLSVWGGPSISIASSPADHDEWTVSPTAIQLGAGPVPRSEFAFSGSAAFFVHHNRSVLGAARLVDGTWTDWPIHCTNGEVELLTSGEAGDVAVVCHAGAWGDSDSPLDGSALSYGTHIYVSGDDGVTLTEVPPPDAFAGDPTSSSGDSSGQQGFSVLAHPDPDTFVVHGTDSDGGDLVSITRDRGAGWSALEGPSEAPVQSLTTSGRRGSR